MPDVRTFGTMNKQERIQVRISTVARARFEKACKRKGEIPSEVIRRLMSDYTDKPAMS
jgi:hypothetical protein